jgi:PucR C-terminal helix-turn-helix domain/GGDEF-like domain
MGERQPGIWIPITSDLKMAAVFPERREELLSRALERLLTTLSASGAALIWPCPTKKMAWKVYYAGVQRKAMHRWLSARLDPSPEVTIGLLEQDLTRNLSDMPPSLVYRLHPVSTSPTSPRAIWVVWTVLASMSALPDEILDGMERIRQAFEAVLEVEDKEDLYFSSSSPVYDRELIEILAHDDAHALSAFLALTRVVARADFTFWGKAYHDIVETTSHLGARNSGFGFSLERGHGVGGRVAASGMPIVGDYRNSPYRDSSVSDIVDSEQVRSGIALPIHYNTTTMTETSRQVAAVLYVTRRTNTHFSLAERLLLHRLTHMLEPLPQPKRSLSYASCGLPQVSKQKAAWHELLLQATCIEEVETWASELIKGVVIVSDEDEHPYTPVHGERIQPLRALHASQPEDVLTLSLPAIGEGQDVSAGRIYLYPSISLPPAHWPDFLTDLVVACRVVLARMHQAQDSVSRQRERWVRTLLQGKASPLVEQEGYRLGLPAADGQLWVLAWSSQSSRTSSEAHWRSIVERVVLDWLKSPLMFCEDDMAVILLTGQTPQSPARLRDALLNHFGGQPLWIVHGAYYHSLQELKLALTRVLTLAQKARHEDRARYLLDVDAFGLDSLLENPKLTEELETFARKLLTPLIEYDTVYGAQLTETFVLSQTLGSAQAVAEQLRVHVNTIRNRLHRIGDILGTDLTSPKEQAALALAAFTWKRMCSSSLNAWN